MVSLHRCHRNGPLSLLDAPIFADVRWQMDMPSWGFFDSKSQLRIMRIVIYSGLTGNRTMCNTTKQQFMKLRCRSKPEKGLR